MDERVRKLAKEAPRSPGVYLFKNVKDEVIYVGKAKNLAARLSSYTLPERGLLPKTARMVSEAVDLETRLVGSELEALLLEARLIRQNLPRYNSQSRDDKLPLYIRVTSERFPKVMTVRKLETKNGRALYFGPFPSSMTVKMVLKTLRRVFPFCSQMKIGKRPCFYSHIRLCNPCPSEIVKYSGGQRDSLTKEYRKNVLCIKRILEGRIDRIIKDLEREMESFARSEAFEEAARVKKKIEQLRYIVQKPIAPEEFLANPNLVSERAKRDVSDFWERVGAYFDGAPLPRLAEAYDVSNISGREAVGSQVTFFDGLPDKSGYKRYKVRAIQRPNDVGMMREVLSRRFRHQEWGVPGLVLVDGGKQQVRAVLEVLGSAGLAIPVVGLAKRNEEVVVPKVDGGFERVLFRRADGGLHFVQRIRDEAHRFAQSYHHHLMRRRLEKVVPSI